MKVFFTVTTKINVAIKNFESSNFIINLKINFDNYVNLLNFMNNFTEVDQMKFFFNNFISFQ